MRRHLGKEYKVHEVSFDDPTAIHMDSSLILLKPGLAVLNPDKEFGQKELFIKAGWKVRICSFILKSDFINIAACEATKA